jgi:hypothetical protein
MTPPSQLTRTLRVNLAAATMAKALYLGILETNTMPGRPWQDLPLNLRAGLIECCGRLLLHLGPVNTHEAMSAAVYELATELAQGVAKRDPLMVRRARVLPMEKPSDLDPAC